MKKNNGLKLLKVFTMALFVMLSTAGQNIIGHAAEAPEQEKIGVDKTASALNSNDETTVNLSIVAPTLKYKQNVDLVFVVDASAGSDYAAYASEAGKLLDKLAASPSVNLNVGSIVFDGWGHDGYSLATGKGDGLSNESGLVPLNSTTLPDIKKAVVYATKYTQYGIRHSNSEEPLRMANRWLENDTTVDKANKFIVFISDMLTYTYGGTTTYNNTAYAETPVSKNFAGDGIYLQQNPTDGRNLAKLFADYDAGILQKDPTWNTETFTNYNTTYMGFEVLNAWRNFFTNIYQKTPNPGLITSAQYDALVNAANCARQGVTAYEKSLCLTKTALETSINNGYNVMAWIDDVSYAGTYDKTFNNMTTDFAAYLPKMGVQTTLRSSGNDIANFLEGLEEKIVVVFRKGTITDVIGHQFELEGYKDASASPFHLSYDGTEYTSVKTGDNEWSFGTPDAGVYPFVAKYMTDSKTINLTINTELKDYKKLNLSYTLYLTDFSQSSDALYTNESAVVNYVDYNDRQFESEFPRPSVQYTAEPMVSSIPVSKTVTGTDIPQNETFNFALSADAGNPANGADGLKTSAQIQNITLPDTAAVLNDAFGTGTFTAAGTYQYNITETAGTTKDFTYDQSSYLWTVRVANGAAHEDTADPMAVHPTHPSLTSSLVQTKDSTGKAVIGAEVKSAAFTNKFERVVTPITPDQPETPAEPVTPERPALPTTNESTSVNTGVDDRGTMAVFFGAVCVLAGVWFVRKRFSEE